MNTPCNNCGHCDSCQKKTCKNPCGCAEPVFSVEAMPDDPTVLRFNVNGKSVWYDFTSVVKAAETCTTLSVDSVARTLNYLGECQENTIAARELGAILHLSDLADVDANSIENYGILNYQTSADCGDGCEGVSNGWVASNPVDLGTTSLDYILGANKDGKLQSLMAPTDTTSFSYLAWAAQGKAKWVKPTVVSTIPTDTSGAKYPLYLDPSTGEIVVYKQEAN